MSRVLIPFQCEQCGRHLHKQVYDGVDVSKEPQYRAKVMDASIFDFVCPHCGNVNGVIYPFLYHDPSRRFMIQLVDSSFKGDPFVDVFDETKETERAMKQVTADMKSRYRFRTVRTPNALMEKIILFENDLDDRAVEIMKAGLLAADPSILSLWFAPTENGPVFLIEDETGFSRSVPFDAKLYEEVMEKAPAFSDAETEIDQNWIKAVSQQGESACL